MGDVRVEACSGGEYEMERVLREGVRGGEGDVGVLAGVCGGDGGDGSGEERVSVLIWHYHDDDTPGPPATIKLSVILPSTFQPNQINMKHFRIDSEYSNAFTTWKKMGEPQQPTAEQYAALEEAGRLALVEEREVEVAGEGKVSLDFELMRQGVSLLVFA